MITQSPDLTEIINTKLQSLSPEQQYEVLNFVEYLLHKTNRSKPIWEKIQDLTSNIPEEEWAALPEDGSFQHDHYLYQSPKREA